MLFPVDDPVLASRMTDGRRRDRAAAAALAIHADHGGGRVRTPEDLVLCGCLTAMLAAYWLSPDKVPLPGADDEEGAAVPDALQPVVDGHVHVFPDRVFDALWRWFEAYAWPIRYKLRAPELVRFLFDRKVGGTILLHYAHKPGMARGLNAFVAELAKTDRRIAGFATVLPSEPDAPAIVEEARALGLEGVKLHCHVQAFAPDSPEAMVVFAKCEELGLPVLVHTGREPKSPMYSVDTHAICSADRLERVLVAHPRLKLCVPHFGADEYEAYAKLLDQYENLYLDTTMLLSGWCFDDPQLDVLERHPGRILYGTDFPNLPYAWDRELKRIAALGLSDAALESVLHGASTRFLGRPLTAA